MKLIGARFSGGLAPMGTWAPMPPKFKLLKPPARLRVPLFGWPAGSISFKSAGTEVAAGASLTDSMPQAVAAAIAPLPGRIVGPCKLTTVDKHTVEGVE